MRELVLFFSSATKLSDWHRLGLLDREKLIYERLIATGYYDRITWFTYGATDQELLKRLQADGKISDRISVITPPKWLAGKIGAVFYSVVGPLLHRRRIAEAAVLKTNQTNGSWTAAIAAFVSRKPLVYRSAYIWSAGHDRNGRTVLARIARVVERALVRLADTTIVSSQLAVEHYAALAPNADVTLLPTFVDVRNFKQISNYDPSLPILFVGRYEDFKNLPVLVEAVAEIGHPLTLYGYGSLQTEIEALAKRLGAKVEIKAQVMNDEIARIHHQHSIFALVSLYEGMPKALIEAMSSGMICVGTDVPGIHELIEDGVQGYLSPTTTRKDIVATLRRAIAEMHPDMGRRARNLILERHDIDAVVHTEARLHARAVARHSGHETELASVGK